MDIADIVSNDYVEIDPETPVSKLAGTFTDPQIRGVVVRGDEFEGIVTRRQLATSHHQPDEKVGSLVWHVPRVHPHEDVRRVAQLMIDSDSRVLPVFEGEDLVGVVTVDDVLTAVQPFLSAATVAEAHTPDLITVSPETTVGRALHDFREHHITHLPVVEDDAAVGVLSLFDVVELTVRPGRQPRGGDASGTDSFGGSVSKSAGRARRGGYGAREGERERVLDLPVRDVMARPVRTIDPGATLETAVDRMFENGTSSLVVTENGEPFGIVTKTDVLDALTWEAEGNRAVQVYGSDLVDDMSYEDIVAVVDGFDDKNGGMSVLDARIHFQRHSERLRGTPLVLARVRLHTDRGMFVASGEGYGARQALGEARDLVERQIRDDKTHGRTKKHPDEAFWERRFGWLLEE